MLTFDISLFQYCYVLYCYKVISIKSLKGINFYCSLVNIIYVVHSLEVLLFKTARGQWWSGKKYFA